MVERPVVVVDLLHPVGPCHDCEGARAEPRRQHEALGEEHGPDASALADAGARAIGMAVCGPEVERHPGTVYEIEAYPLLVGDPDRVSRRARN
jgi:hypothetical protein